MEIEFCQILFLHILRYDFYPSFCWCGVSHWFADDIILYRENTKDFTITLLKWINELRKVAGHKINIQKLMAILYTNNELFREIKKKFTIASKRINCPGINLTKEVKAVQNIENI